MPPLSSPPAAARVPALLRRHPAWWGIWLLSHLPFGVLYVLADVLAWLLGRVVRYRRRVVQANLRKSFPAESAAELRRLERDFYVNLADVAVETIKLATISRAEMAARLRYVNYEQLDATIRSGQPALVLGSHLGNWEWMLPAAAATFGFRVDAVYHQLHNPFAEALVRHLRTRLGGHLVRMQDVGRDVVRHRAVPRALCLIADQTPPGGEIQFYARFLNQDTPFFVGADKLAAGFRLPVFFLAIRRVRRGYYEAEPRLFHDGATPLPIPPKHVSDDPATHPITAYYARALEADVHRSPADYLWSHKRWKNARPGK